MQQTTVGALWKDANPALGDFSGEGYDLVAHFDCLRLSSG